MAKAKVEYGNDSISQLKGADRVRKRPAVIFGSDGLDGCEHAFFEILSNSIDESREGYGTVITVRRYLDNSIFMSLFTAFVGMVIAFVTAYCTARLKTKTSKLLHIISIISLAIPGLVLGLSYVITFKSSFIYGTLIILILANSIHFFASPYLMMYNALNKVNENLESTGQVLGIPRYRIIFDVIIPQCKYTLLEIFSYFFVNSMMTISAVSFLATRTNKPLSLMINQFEAFNMMECAAVVALMILFVNVIMKTIVYLIKRKGVKYVNKKSI